MATISGTPTNIANSGNYTAGSGSNRVVVFGVCFSDNAAGTTVTGVTFGGIACHRIGGAEADPGSVNRAYVDLWYMNEADSIPAGAQAVTASYSAGILSTRILCFTVQGANQTDFSVTDSDITTSGTSLSLSLTSLDSSFAVAVANLLHNASNTDVTWTWTGSTENADGTSGAPNQRFSSSHRDVTTGTTESIGASWSVAVAAASFAVLIKDVSSSSSATVTPAQATLTVSGKTPTTSAFQNVRIREILVNGSGQAIGNATDITLLVWYAARCGGAPDVSLNGLTTDSEGSTSWSIPSGTLGYQDPIFYVAQNAVSLSHYTAARLIPSYE